VSEWGTSLIQIYEHGSSGWAVAREFRGPPATAQGDGFGFKLALESDAMVASSVSGDFGAAYVFDVTP
jgi:hypothetical protein